MFSNNLKALFIFSTSIFFSGVIIATTPTQELLDENSARSQLRVGDFQPIDYEPVYIGYGRTQALTSKPLTASLDGQINFVHTDFNVGSFVETGQTLYKIECDEYRNQLTQAVNHLKIIDSKRKVEQGNQQFAKHEYESALSVDKEVSKLQKSLILRKPQLDEINAQYKIAESEFKLAQRNVDKCEVVSDSQYLVVDKSLSDNYFIKQGDVLADLVDMSKLIVPVPLPQRVIENLKVGDPVSIFTAENTEFTGQIKYIPPFLSESNLLQQVHIIIDNKLMHIKLNQFIHVKFSLPLQKNVLKLPNKIVVNSGYYFVDVDGRLAHRDVSVLWLEDKHQIVENSLKHGERVVTSEPVFGDVGSKVDIYEGKLND